MISRQETQSLLNQVRKLTSSPVMNPNPVSAFITAPVTSNAHAVSFNLADSTGVGSVDLLSSPFAEPSSASIAQSWTSEQKSYQFSAPSVSDSGALHYWIRLNPQGTSGKAKLIGPQKLLVNG